MFTESSCAIQVLIAKESLSVIFESDTLFLKAQRALWRSQPLRNDVERPVTWLNHAR
jgi:hypothetical protein